jgi:hypothetical protein
VVVAGLVLAIALRDHGKNAAQTRPASPAAVLAVTSVSPAEWQRAPLGKTILPEPIQGPSLQQDGKPLVLYIGAEYCPFCAAERWAVVNALSRFGTWSRLGATASAAADIHPNTATFSFHGAGFTSPYVSFAGVETGTNQRASGGYGKLDTPTAAQAATESTFGRDSQDRRPIPFVDIANKYRIVGATYDVSLLAGKTLDEIAANLSNPNDSATKAILASANAITAAICDTTDNKPANVCVNPAITSIQQSPAVKPVAVKG